MVTRPFTLGCGAAPSVPLSGRIVCLLVDECRSLVRPGQPPFDAFWGARYAIVADPDGNDVGLMSPIDESRRTWPPAESPAP